MNLEYELRRIWDKYEPQRDAERNAARTREEANRELKELNERRMKVGLPYVCEPRLDQNSPLGMQSANVWVQPHKTWRDEFDAELLSTVKRFLADQ